MRSFAAVALFAGAALATGEYTETAYSTQEVTITSCGPDVPDCPSSSTYSPTSQPTYAPPPVYTSETPVYTPPPAPTSTPVYTSPVYSSPIASSPIPPVYTSPAGGSCPPAVTSTYTVTVTAGPSTPVYTSPAPYPTGSSTAYTPGVPSSTGGYPTYPSPSSPPINAGGKVQAGVLAAAAGAIAAFFL